VVSAERTLQLVVAVKLIEPCQHEFSDEPVVSAEPALQLVVAVKLVAVIVMTMPYVALELVAAVVVVTVTLQSLSWFSGSPPLHYHYHCQQHDACKCMATNTNPRQSVLASGISRSQNGPC